MPIGGSPCKRSLGKSFLGPADDVRTPGRDGGSRFTFHRIGWPAFHVPNRRRWSAKAGFSEGLARCRRYLAAPTRTTSLPPNSSPIIGALASATPPLHLDGRPLPLHRREGRGLALAAEQPVHLRPRGRQSPNRRRAGPMNRPRAGTSPCVRSGPQRPGPIGCVPKGDAGFLREGLGTVYGHRSSHLARDPGRLSRRPDSMHRAREPPAVGQQLPQGAMPRRSRMLPESHGRNAWLGR
jgi:hypothetical protein